MGVFRDRAGSLLRQIFSQICDYRFSIGTAVLCAIYEAVKLLLEEYAFLDLGFDDDAVFRFAVVFGLAALFSETCFMEKGRRKLLGLLSGAVFAGLVTFFIGVDEDSLLFGLKGVFFYKKAQEVMAGGIFLMLVLTVYFSYRKTAVRFEEYILTLFVNWMIVFSLYFILIIGAGFVCSCVDTLLLEGWSNITEASVILISGFFLVPGAILALRGTHGTNAFFINKLDGEEFCRAAAPVLYILSFMAVCALATVYVYAAGILIRWEFPSNEVFPILTTLFCLGMPIWMVTGSLLGESSYSRIMARLPYVFAPLILLQIYAIGVRIWEFGLTRNRYAGVMAIVFEAGTVLCWHVRRRRMEQVLLILSGLIVLTFLMPGVNGERLSEKWQQAWLEKYYKMAQNGEDLSPREYKRMGRAYLYLKQETPGGLAGRYDDYPADILEMAEMQYDGGQEKVDRYVIHGCKLVGSIPVEGFKSMYMLEDADEGLEPDFSGFRFQLRGTEEEITVDISDFAGKAMEYIEAHPDADKEEVSIYLRSFNRIDLGQGRLLYINHFQISYEKGIRDGRDYFKWNGGRNISGMMLSLKEESVF